jgi:hypothetical protein
LIYTYNFGPIARLTPPRCNLFQTFEFLGTKYITKFEILSPPKNRPLVVIFFFDQPLIIAHLFFCILVARTDGITMDIMDDETMKDLFSNGMNIILQYKTLNRSIKKSI